jgi:uncharacterized protein
LPSRESGLHVKAFELLRALPQVGGLVFLSACASDRYWHSTGHAEFEKRNWDQAAEVYARDARDPGSNQLLFKLDQATALFAARKYEEAIPIFLEAEELAEIKDYTSISEEVGVLATGQGVRGYKGEDFEKVLINVYLALSFAATGQIESAQVECRKINLLLHRMISEGKRNYEESPFARYLAGILWEASGEWNSAYIDYKLAYELDPSLPGLPSDLIYTAGKMGFASEESQWRQAYPHVPVRRDQHNGGELIVVYQQGRSPRKVPRREDHSLPRFVSRPSEDYGARVVVGGETKGELQRSLDISGTSVRYLEDRIGRLKMAQLAGVATKAAIGYGVAKATKDDDLGVLAFYALLLSDRADLRSWSTLPQSLQILRVPLSAGTHSVSLEILGAGGSVLRHVEVGEVEIKAKSKVFVVER